MAANCRDALLSLIATGEAAMEPPALALWKWVRIRPVKWVLPPWGDRRRVLGGAVVGQECVWYNDIEDGFNVSWFEAFGRIGDYWLTSRN